jgi:hypothetical protein
MAMSGPQIGGFSLIFHAIILIVSYINGKILRLISLITRFFQKKKSPFPPNSK